MFIKLLKFSHIFTAGKPSLLAHAAQVTGTASEPKKVVHKVGQPTFPSAGSLHTAHTYTMRWYARHKMELFKFSVYVFIPIGAVIYFQEPRVFRRIIEQKNYIRYPPESEKRPEDLLDNKYTRTSNNYSPSNFANSTTSPSLSSTSSAGATSTVLRPRRYGLFGPRDDLEALTLKRLKRDEASNSR